MTRKSIRFRSRRVMRDSELLSRSPVDFTPCTHTHTHTPPSVSTMNSESTMVPSDVDPSSSSVTVAVDDAPVVDPSSSSVTVAVDDAPVVDPSSSSVTVAVDDAPVVDPSSSSVTVAVDDAPVVDPSSSSWGAMDYTTRAYMVNDIVSDLSMKKDAIVALKRKYHESHLAPIYEAENDAADALAVQNNCDSAAWATTMEVHKRQRLEAEKVASRVFSQADITTHELAFYELLLEMLLVTMREPCHLLIKACDRDGWSTMLSDDFGWTSTPATLQLLLQFDGTSSRDAWEENQYKGWSIQNAQVDLLGGKYHDVDHLDKPISDFDGTKVFSMKPIVPLSYLKQAVQDLEIEDVQTDTYGRVATSVARIPFKLVSIPAMSREEHARFTDIIRTKVHAAQH